MTAATDQFAFCVALWEALAGRLPFPGDRLDEVRAAIERGPSALDTSALPRALRPILVRGLARDPGDRWPDMNSLLTAIERTRRSVAKRASIAGVAVAFAAGVAMLAVQQHRAPDSAPSHTELPRRFFDKLGYAVERAAGAGLFFDPGTVGFRLRYIQEAAWQHAGLADDDLVKTINGVPIRGTEDLRRTGLGYTSRMVIEIERGGAARTITITTPEPPRTSPELATTRVIDPVHVTMQRAAAVVVADHPAWLEYGTHTKHASDLDASDRVPREGVVVEVVAPRSFYDHIGLYERDTITRVDEMPIRAPADLRAAFERLRTASSLAITVERVHRRNGAPEPFTITLTIE